MSSSKWRRFIMRTWHHQVNQRVNRSLKQKSISGMQDVCSGLFWAWVETFTQFLLFLGFWREALILIRSCCIPFYLFFACECAIKRKWQLTNKNLPYLNHSLYIRDLKKLKVWVCDRTSCSRCTARRMRAFETVWQTWNMTTSPDTHASDWQQRFQNISRTVGDEKISKLITLTSGLGLFLPNETPPATSGALSTAPDGSPTFFFLAFFLTSTGAGSSSDEERSSSPASRLFLCSRNLFILASATLALDGPTGLPLCPRGPR